MSEQEPSLHNAYALKTPEDSIRLYADWAKSYDEQFAEASGYVLPEVTAKEFLSGGGRGPVLDVGAGTGLLGVLLNAAGVRVLDATDISQEMLEQASRKDVYRDTIQADLTVGVPAPADSYAGIVSSGTFTHGHVGPEVIPGLLRIARRDALFALSINAAHYHAHGFAALFDDLQAQGQIKRFSRPEHRIYGPNNQGLNKDDTAFIAVFRKA